MDVQMLINVMAWGLVIIGGALVGALTWFAIRIVDQLDKLGAMFREAMHEHDLRIQRLEDWREMALNGRGPPRNSTE